MSESLENFINLIKRDPQKAKALFFSETFKEEYLNGEEERKLYHQLLLGRNREQILEEFLISIGGKEPVELKAVKTLYQADLSNLDEPLEITVKKEGWGYLVGKAETVGSFTSVKQETFSGEDFEDGQLHFYVELYHLPEDGAKDILTIETMYQSISIEIVYHEMKTERQKEEQSREKKLFELYIDFCTGKIPLEDFAERGHMVLQKMPDHPKKNSIYKLMELHLDLLLGEEDAPGRMPDVSEYEEYPMILAYVLYLKAFYKRDQDSIQTAVSKISEIFSQCGQTDAKGFLFWFLMQLDQNLAQDLAGQAENMKELYQEGIKNPLLRFEGCCVIGEQPELLHRIESYEIWLLEFGAREKLLNENLVQRICFLISRNKIFSEEVLWMLICVYKEYPSPEVLQGICALMIQGNCMDEDCHPYYEKALHQGIQLIGLQEAFLRTIPDTQYPVLPEEILMYFTYSNSLSRQEQGALYANVVKNRRKYRRLFPNYEEIIRTFLREELKRGQLNHHLVTLYHYYFEDLLEDEDSAEDLGNIIFYQELTCNHPFAQKVEIQEDWKRNADLVSLQGKEAYIEVFDPQAAFVFFDQEENRYLGSVSYQKKYVWSKEQISAYCERAKGTNIHYLMYLGAQLGRKTSLTENDFPVVLSVLKTNMLKESYQHEIFEKVLDYYWKNGKEDQLKEALSHVDWKQLPVENRKHMIEYFIAGGFYEEALRGVHQYGYHFLRPELLKDLCLHALTTLSTRRSEVLIGMCIRAFDQGQENSEIIGYLQKYFRGTKDQMLKLFRAGAKISMYMRSFAERVLVTCVEEGVDGTEFEVFSEYLKQADADDTLIDSVLVEYVSFACHSSEKMPVEFYELIGRKIDAGKMDWMYQWLYLDHYKERKQGLSDQILRRVQKISDFQIQTENVFPVLFEYLDVLKLPKYLCSRTFIEYWAEEGKRLTFHYANSRGSRWREIPMKELLPGYYVVSVVMFADELADSFITIPGEEKRRRKDINITDHISESRESRFYELNEMLKNQHQGQIQGSMEQYEVKRMMTEFIKPMLED